MQRGAVEEVADGVVAVAGSRTSFYLLLEDGDVTVLDTGYPGDRDLLLEGLRAAGRSFADVSAVLLTHGHVDHLGSAEFLRRDHDAQVLCHRDEAPHVRGDREERISERDMIARLWRPKMWSFLANVLRAKALSVEHVGSVGTFDDGDELDLPGGPVAVCTPGHTSGHCSYHLPERGALLTGDALVTRDSLTGDDGPRLLNHLFNHDHAAAVGSLERLRPIPAEIVLPGHGEAWRGSPASAVEIALGAEDER